MLELLVKSLVQNLSYYKIPLSFLFKCYGALITSFIITAYILTKIIRSCEQSQKFFQPIRVNGPKLHLINKQKTPSLGGIAIIIAITCNSLFWGDITNLYLWLLIVTLLLFGLIGFYDDYKKNVPHSQGLSVHKKLISQTLISFFILLAIHRYSPLEPHLSIPFLKNKFINCYYLYFLFAMVVIVGASNAVNLSDGLDGLAIGLTSIIIIIFATVSYLTNNNAITQYFYIFYINRNIEVSLFCLSIFGSSLGFLWFNGHPAKIFMGDTGSLALGAVLGTISIIIKQECLLLIGGSIFVIEVLSVMMQVSYYKIYNKRIFKMAPLHHHFELSGLSESKIVSRFLIVSILVGMLALLNIQKI